VLRLGTATTIADALPAPQPPTLDGWARPTCGRAARRETQGLILAARFGRRANKRLTGRAAGCGLDAQILDDFRPGLGEAARQLPWLSPSGTTARAYELTVGLRSTRAS